MRPRARAHPRTRQGATICINPLLPDRQHARLITCSTPPFLPGAALHFDPLDITIPGVRFSPANNTGLEARAPDPYFPTSASTSASQTALRAHCGAAWRADRGGGGPGRSTSCSSPSTSTSRLAQQPIPMRGPPTSLVLQRIQKLQRPTAFMGGRPYCDCDTTSVWLTNGLLITSPTFTGGKAGPPLDLPSLPSSEQGG